MFGRKVNLGIFVLCLLVSGAVSISIGQDSNFDLLNYHIYNPYAFLTDRLAQDFYVADVRTYFNPLLDIPYYLMLMHMDSYPYIITFIQGLYYGVLCFLIYLISFTVLKPDSKLSLVFPICASLLGVTNVLLVSEIGTTFNDIQVGIFVLLAFYILIKNLFEPEGKKRLWLIFLSGLLLGMITGLKLTAAIPTLGLILAIIFFYKKIINFRQVFIIFLAGCTIGFLLTNGYWMYLMYSHFQNPFFPYFNEIFKSEYYPPISASDDKFMPVDIAHWLFYPFFWIQPIKTYSSTLLQDLDYACEIPFIDLRYAFCYLSALVLAGLGLLKKIGKKKNPAVLSDSDMQKQLIGIFLVLFIVLSYVVWIIGLATLRYYIPCACLMGIVIMLAAKELSLRVSSKFIGVFAAVLVTLTCLFYVKHVDWGRRDYLDKTMVIPDLKIADNSIVFFGKDNSGCELLSQSYLIPFQNPNAHYIGLAHPEEDIIEKHKKVVDKIIADSGANKFYFIFTVLCHDINPEKELVKYNKGEFKCARFETPNNSQRDCLYYICENTN